jgi:hypothetical protein
MRMLKALALMVVGTAGLCQTQSEQPTLGDLVRQNQNRPKRAVRVITEDDLPRHVAPETAAGSRAPQAATDQKRAEAAGASEAKGESQNQTASAKDGSKVAGLKKQLADLKDQRDGWKQSAKEYEKLLETEANDFRRETYERALSNDKQNAQICQQKIDQVETDLAKVEKAAGSNPNAATQPGANQASRQ